MFAKRLSFIMELTSTSSSALGRACSVDPSYISRLKSGSRALPKNASFLPSMSMYLAKRLKADYQRKIMCDTLKFAQWPLSEAKGAELIEKWLSDEQENTVNIEPILNSFTASYKPKGFSEKQRRKLSEVKRYYFGDEGKREAVLHFFGLVLAEKEPQTLLLSSEEDMGWLYEDKSFAVRWATELAKILQAGNRVKIVHNIGRDLNELIQAVAKWIPVYTSGMIEPYYYPRLRDGISRRTLFIAPKTAAVVSSSVMHKTAGMLNELITDREAVNALKYEYENYFALCRPLMRILTLNDSEELWQIWQSLADSEGNLICMSGMPTLATMPVEVAKSMQKRAPKSRILELRNTGAAAFEKLIKRSAYTEILPELQFADTSMYLPCASHMGAPGLCYSKEEFEAHKKNALLLENANGNYKIITHNNIPPKLLLYAKEARGVIMVRNNEDCTAFAISEPNLTNAFWDYLHASGQVHKDRSLKT